MSGKVGNTEQKIIENAGVVREDFKKRAREGLRCRKRKGSAENRKSKSLTGRQS